MYKLIDENGIQQNYSDHTKVTVIQTFDSQLFASVNDARLLKLAEAPVHADKSQTFVYGPFPRFPHENQQALFLPPMFHNF